MKKAFLHAKNLYTGKGIRKKDGRKLTEEDLGKISDGAIVFEENGKILWVGHSKDFPKEYARVQKKDLKNKHSIMPSFVECHSHLVFAGDRASEFARRCAGVSYEQIAQEGGGILTTMQATRAASKNELLQLSVKRVKEFLKFGVKTIEIKSGYGLNFESEIKSLEVIASLKKKFPHVKIQSTFLGAHAYPKDFSKSEYLDLVTNKMLPEISKRKLADACDVFVDEGYFSLSEGRLILEKAKSLGLQIKIHADELVNTEATSLAVELGALSCDHLLKVSDQGIQKLADSDTVGVLLPGTAFYLKADYAPARRLIDAGACIALSTDYNPGSSMMSSLPVVMSLSALYMQMSCAEIFAGVTYNAAKALGLHQKKGTLEKGKDADILVLPFENFEESYYRFAWNPN